VELVIPLQLVHHKEIQVEIQLQDQLKQLEEEVVEHLLQELLTVLPILVDQVEQEQM
jgi:iron-sulfur cluster repair protein YtfE (RIC family)